MKNVVKVEEAHPLHTNRRNFLRISGLGAIGAGLLLAGCNDDDDNDGVPVAFLQNGLGADSIPKPDFDFTAGGLFNPFGDYQQFLALAQAFEDTGVRAYKGQAGNLIAAPDLLQAALQIHSVEARHASEVRRIRNQKGWIIGSDRGGLPVQAQPVYDGEQNAVQAGFNTSSVNNGSLGPAIPAAAGPESFDEPLTGAEATAIASLFIQGT